MLFKERMRFLLQKYDVVRGSVTTLTPSERLHNFNLKTNCLTWFCNDQENCPFVLKIVPSDKTFGKTEAQLVKGSY